MREKKKMKDWDEGVTQENVPYVILSMSGQINLIGSRSFSDRPALIWGQSER